MLAAFKRSTITATYEAIKHLRQRVPIRFPGEMPPKSGFPAPDTGDKKFNSHLVAPT
jgi:hypothetical protein